MQEEQKREETEAEAAAVNQTQVGQNAVINNNGGPNIIGNVEDMQSMQLAQEEETPHLGGVDVTMDQQFDEEGSKFKDITGDLKRSKRKRGKSPFWYFGVNKIYSYDKLSFILFKMHVSIKSSFFAHKKHSGRLWLFWRQFQANNRVL